MDFDISKGVDEDFVLVQRLNCMNEGELRDFVFNRFCKDRKRKDEAFVYLAHILMFVVGVLLGIGLGLLRCGLG